MGNPALTGIIISKLHGPTRSIASRPIGVHARSSLLHSHLRRLIVVHVARCGRWIIGDLRGLLDSLGLGVVSLLLVTGFSTRVDVGV
jgi:hypothetical protein